MKGRLLDRRDDIKKKGNLYAVANLPGLMGKPEFAELLCIWLKEMEQKNSGI